MKRIRINLTVSHESVLNRGICDVLQGVQLRPDGKVIVPINIGNGYVIGKPAPCGTWEIEEETL